jgi:Phosphoglucose isomerase
MKAINGGVELGKALAQRIGREPGAKARSAGHDSSTTVLTRRYVESPDRSAT